MGSNADGQDDGQSGCSQPGEALPGEMAVAGLQDNGVGHNPSMWMEQRDTTCPEVLAFASHTSITSIFLNI